MLIGLPASVRWSRAGVGAASGHWRSTHHRGTTEGLPSNARVGYSAKSALGLPEEPMNSSPLLGHCNASRRTRSIFGSVEFPCGRYGGRNVAPSVLRWTENHSLGAVAVPSGCSIGAVAVLETTHRSISAPVRPVSPQFIGSVAVRLYNHSLCTGERGGRDATRNGADNSAKAGADGSQTSKRGRK